MRALAPRRWPLALHVPPLITLLMIGIPAAISKFVLVRLEATLECELLDRRSFRSQTEARMAVFAFIEGFYNPARRHSALGYLSPIEYEARAMAEND